ncbi:hypothetical protein BDF14DRAFT_1958656 [Spinellus fusiger]|nr:hypothetical protein BDF14DRAFT_1958656 [Spinellus fusiger]
MLCLQRECVLIRGQIHTEYNQSTSLWAKRKEKGNTVSDRLSALSDPQRLSVHGDLLAPLLVPRVAGTPGNERVRYFITNHFQKLGWDVQLDTFTDTTPLGNKSFTNIIATKNPEAKRRLVLAAHFDSKHFDDFEFIGATDSAVPCAILLHLGETLGSFIPMSHPTTLQLLFFDGEEAFVSWSATDSTYGARHLASAWENSPARTPPARRIKTSTVLGGIEMLVLLDLLGTPNTVIANYFRSTSWAFHRIVALEQRLESLKLFSGYSKDNVPLSPMFNPDSYRTYDSYSYQDDHLPFMQRGVNILHVIPYRFPPVWHNPADNADCIDPSTVEKLSLLFNSFVAEYLELDLLVKGLS